ncbi:MAG: hypothetical protein AAGA28_01490 [Pseudomonadota bacterium]
MSGRQSARGCRSIGKLDAEDLVVLILLAYAAQRDDQELFSGLKAYSTLPKTSGHIDVADVDHDLLARIKEKCPPEETSDWNRALAECLTRGDAQRYAALRGLMRCRVAEQAA